MSSEQTAVNCSLSRRMATIFYDCLLLGSVLFFATLVILPLIGNGAIESGNLAYNVFLLILCYLYFCWQWIVGKQTLGMRSWQIYVVNEQMEKPDWKQASLRFLFAIVSWCLFGLGFLWALFDKDKLALHDRLSKTHLVFIKKRN